MRHIGGVRTPASRSPALRAPANRAAAVPLLALPAVLATLVMLMMPDPMAIADEPCRIAKGSSPVAKACAEGGIARAKQVMKEMIKQGRAAGVKLECDECHKEPARYDVLTADARDKFKKLQQAIEPAKPAPEK